MNNMAINQHQGRFPRLLSFALAKDFRHPNGQPFVWEKNKAELVGHVMRMGVGSLADTFFKQVRNPATLVALTALCSLAVTLTFYPEATLNVIATVCPIALKLEGWMVRAALYILTQTTVVGIFVRAWGRVDNTELANSWKAGNLIPVYPGDW